jgi:hypothetical protein
LTGGFSWPPSRNGIVWEKSCPGVNQFLVKDPDGRDHGV